MQISSDLKSLELLGFLGKEDSSFVRTWNSWEFLGIEFEAI